MSTEREKTPREGTARNTFVRVIEGGIGVHETRKIAELTGWTRRKVAQTRSDVQAAGMLERTTPELTTLTRHTQAATILSLIEEYRRMGLSIPEIQFAVQLEKETELSYESVKGCIIRSTRAGHLRKLDKEEISDIKKDTQRLTPEEKKENVAAMLQARSALLRNNQPLPTDRLEWKKTIMQTEPVVDAGLTLNQAVNMPEPELGAEEKLYVLRNLPLPVPTDLNENDISFLNRLISNGLIDQNNLVFFKTLEDLFAKSNRQEDFDRLPPEIKLRLEAFTRAIMQEVKHHSVDSRTKFTELGLQFGKEWFYNQTSTALKEQKFIADKIRPQPKTPVMSHTVNVTPRIPLTALDLHRDDI